MKILMIGHGMVGHKFIESVLEQAGDDIEARELGHPLFWLSRSNTTALISALLFLANRKPPSMFQSQKLWLNPSDSPV